MRAGLEASIARLVQLAARALGELADPCDGPVIELATVRAKGRAMSVVALSIMATTAKEQLAAKVAAMTEDEAREALARLDVADAPLSMEEDAILRARLDAADRGEFVSHEDVMARFRARFGFAKASGQ